MLAECICFSDDLLHIPGSLLAVPLLCQWKHLLVSIEEKEINEGVVSSYLPKTLRAFFERALN